MNSIKNSFLGSTYKNILNPLFFQMNPEDVHDTITSFGNLLGKYKVTKTVIRGLYHFENETLVQKVAGINFSNPVGLSAGFDKDADLTNILPDIGFGFTQVGSVTLKPYQGNPKPRLYRLPKSRGIVVYYGLKNIGVDKIISKLSNSNNPNFPMGISVARTNCKEAVEIKAGIKDYFNCLKKLNNAGIGNFYTINISCPNTFGGEPFTTSARLDSLLDKISSLKVKKPIFIKMPINLSWQDFKKLLDVIVKYDIDGVIIGNLTKKRDPKLIKDAIPKEVNGGISGKPTEKLNNYLITKTYESYKNKLIIIGVGGIFSAEDAYEKIKRGATLVQLITGMIFNGPQLIAEINEGLFHLLKKDGYVNINQAVGAYHKK